MIPELFIIHCKTLLFVGDGKSNNDLIEERIQRDSLDNLPCICATSLKGIFRKHFEEGLKEKMNADYIIDEQSNKNSNLQSSGTPPFNHAYLFSLPLRTNQKQYYSSISPFIVENLLKMAKEFGYTFPKKMERELKLLVNLKPQDNMPMIFNNATNLEIENFVLFEVRKEKLSELKKIIGNNIVIVSSNDMKFLTNDNHLPIIARSNLDKEERLKMRPEQVIPRDSIFTTFMPSEEKIDGFNPKINKEIVQLGKNTSLGYGYSLIYSLQK